MFDSPEILAIIPFYRRPEQLDRCLAALRASKAPVTAWVQDNNVENAGFTKACNLGLKAAIDKRCRFALLINQDCYVRPDAIGNLIAFMEAHPRCAIAGVKQVSDKDPDLIIHGGCRSAYPESIHIAGKKSLGNCAVSEMMPWVNGACLFVRMDAVIEFGLMDENMFLFSSDVDWCYTARMRGWEVWYCAHAEVIHEQGITQEARRDFTIQHVIESDLIYFRDKWINGALAHRVKSEGRPADELYVEAQKAWANRDAEGAEKFARDVLAIAPDHFEAMTLLAMAYTQLDYPARAIELLRKAATIRPLPAPARACLGAAYVRVGAYREAADELKAAIDMGIKADDLVQNYQRIKAKLEADQRAQKDSK